MKIIKCLWVCLCCCSIGKTQIISNAGFETDSLASWHAWHLSGASPWYAWNPSGISKITSGNAHGGIYAVHQSGGETSIEQLLYNLRPNTTYSLEGWIKVGRPGESVLLGVKNYGDTQVTVDIVATAYKKYQVNFTTGATNTQAIVFLYKADTGTAYGDDFSLIIQSVNLLANPAFETGSLSPWTAWNPSGTATLKTDEARSGSYAVQLAGGETSVEQVVSNLQPNTTYTFEGWIRVSAPGESVILGVKNYRYSEVVATGTAYVKYQTSFTTGPVETQATVFLYKPRSGTAYGVDFSLFMPLTPSRGNSTYYIDRVNGRDANEGKSPALAWQSLQKVNNTIFSAGDTILFKYDGVWTGTLSPKGSGEAGKPIVISRYGGTSARPLFNGHGALRVVYLTNQQYWEITNLEIINRTDPGQKKRGIEVENIDSKKLTHIYIRNNLIREILGDNTKDENGSMGIMVVVRKGPKPVRSWFDSVKIENNIVRTVNRTGIGTASEWGCRPSAGCLDGSGYVALTNVEIRNNYVENAGGDGIVPINTLSGIIEYNLLNGANVNSGTPNAGIWCWNGDRNVFQFNEAYNVRTTRDGQGYDIDYGQAGTVFQYNYSHDNEGGFMLICSQVPGGSANSIVRYNISQNDQRGLFALHGPVSNVQIYNNTLYLPAGSTTMPISVSDWNGYAVNAYFTNNIFYLAGAGNWYGWNNIGTKVFDNNIVYGDTAGMPAGRNNLTSDPLLVAPGSGTRGSLVNGIITFGNVEGYQLQAGSPAMGAGKVIANNGGRDYWGNPVAATTAPNIGAYNGAGVERPPAIVLYQPAADDTAIVAEIGDLKISKKEFVWRMNGLRTACLDFFLQHYNVSYTVEDFWDQPLGGVTPRQWIIEKTLQQLQWEKGGIRVMQRYGLLQGYDYRQFLEAFGRENDKRRSLVEKGQIIYGLQQFDAYSFNDYLLSNALLETQRRILVKDPVPEKVLQAYYERMSRDQFGIPPTIAVTCVPVDKSQPGKEIVFKPSARRIDELKWGDLFHQAVLLKKEGAVSDVFKDGNGNDCFLICRKIIAHGYLSFGEVRELVRTHIASERVKQLWASQTEKMKVKVYAGVWELPIK